MDEQAAAVRAMVDENGGKWIGRIYTLLGELGYADITPEIGAEIQARLSAANLSVKPRSCASRFTHGRLGERDCDRWRSTCDSPLGSFRSVIRSRVREDKIDAALPAATRAADQQGLLEPPAGPGE
jgi:hypothetical protein